MSYHVDRLFAAVSALASHGPIKQRLITAYEENLESFEDDDFPVSVRETFSNLRRLMHAVSPANGEGRICASVRKMSKTEADDCAQLMVDIYAEISRADDGEKPLQLQIDDRQAVPPFLVKSG